MKILFNFCFYLLNIINNFVILIFKENLLIKLKFKIEKNSYKAKKILKKKIIFFIPNEIVDWRIDTLLEKEPETIDWINNFFKKKTIFWDIGSNIGIYSIYAAVAHKNIEIVSFEPSTSNLRTLSRNISLNKLYNKIKIFPIALTNKENIFSKIKETNFIEGGAMNVFAENFDHNGKKIKLSTNDYVLYGTNINFILKNKILRIPNYIKIDVDGIEHLILHGGNKFFKNKKIKSVLIEVNENFKNQFKNISKFMKNNNFKLKKKTREEKFYSSKYNKTYNYIFYR